VQVWAGSEPARLRNGHSGDADLSEVFESVQPATDGLVTGPVLGGEDGALTISAASATLLDLTASDGATYSFDVPTESLRRLTGPSATAGSPTLLSYGIGSVLLGTVENTAVSSLNHLLGAPSVSTIGGGDCHIDAAVTWSEVSAYFSHQAFVGYSSPPQGLRNPPPDALATALGLHVGDTLAHAEELYGSALQTSLAQGGSWRVTTSGGYFLDGYLSAPPNAPDQTARIASIEAGDVGCPALSP